MRTPEPLSANEPKVGAPALCPKWEKCNAPICPFDPVWKKRVMHGEDSICSYLSEAVKPGAKALFKDAGREELFKVMSEFIPLVSARWATFRARLEKACTTGSRMARGLAWVRP